MFRADIEPSTPNQTIETRLSAATFNRRLNFLHKCRSAKLKRSNLTAGWVSGDGFPPNPEIWSDQQEEVAIDSE